MSTVPSQTPLLGGGKFNLAHKVPRHTVVCTCSSSQLHFIDLNKQTDSINLCIVLGLN